MVKGRRKASAEASVVGAGEGCEDGVCSPQAEPDLGLGGGQWAVEADAEVPHSPGSVKSCRSTATPLEPQVS